MEKKDLNRPQVKVCGLTNIEEASGCVSCGVDAIGFVFFPKSPRHLSDGLAKEISEALPDEVTKVGVFVNESFSNIMKRVELCRLNAVQLHGRESPDFARRLMKENLLVIKALFTGKEPSFETAGNYGTSAFLLECGKGRLPGGNALVWDYKAAQGFGNNYPFILAGGLDPENVREAVAACSPDALDVSSGVESSPGRKDLAKVKRFMEAVSKTAHSKRKILW